MEWVNNITAQDLREGDIIETPSKFPSDHPLFPDICVPIVKHYAIAVMVDGKLMVVHNTIGNKPSMDTIENLFKYRGLDRVLRTGVSSEEILKRYNECTNRPYHFASWNCEDAVRIWSGQNTIGFDQRNGFGILTAVVIVIILVLVFSGKSNT